MTATVPVILKIHASRWLLAICAIGVVLVGAIVWSATNLAADPGFGYAPEVRPYVIRLSTTPGSDAARSGLRSGDLVDMRQVAPATRFRLITGNFVLGERLTIPISRNGRSLQVRMTTTNRSAVAWDRWLAYAGNLWVVLFAAAIAWRRPQDIEALTLSLFLITLDLGIVLNNPWQTSWPAADAAVNVASQIFFFGSFAVLVAYAGLFARPRSRMRLIMSWVAFITLGLCALYGAAAYCVYWTCAADPVGNAFGTTAFIFLLAISPGVALACAVASLFAARGAERTRLSWAMASIGPYLGVMLVRSIFVIASPALVLSAVVPDVANFILPLGLTYSVLNRRLLDIGFALNRATVFSMVSLTIVGAFMLVEWLLGSWLSRQSHVTNLAVSAAVVVALGFSFRSVHQRVDRLIDAVFFRRRHECEQAIREFARDVAFAAEPATLLGRASDTLKTHADVDYLSFALSDGHNRFGDTAADDPAILALRARHRPVDLHGMNTAFHGEFAYPMAVGGHLVGVLVIGPKKSGDPYAPDESQAIAELATAVGAALAVHALAGNEAGVHTALGDRLRSLGAQS